MPDHLSAKRINNISDYSANPDIIVQEFEVFRSSNYATEDGPWTDILESQHSSTSTPSPLNLPDGRHQITVNGDNKNEDCNRKGSAANEHANNRKQILENILNNYGGMEMYRNSASSLGSMSTKQDVHGGIDFLSGPTLRQNNANQRRKRSSEENDENYIPTKRITLLDSIPPPPPTQLPNSQLQRKNKTLVSLLAKPPTTPAIISRIPSSIISATPQEKLPNLMMAISPSVPPSTAWTIGKAHQQITGPIRMSHQQPPPPNAYMVPHPCFLNRQQQQLREQQLPYQLQTRMKITNDDITSWDSHGSACDSDNDLTKLLDQLFDDVPNTVITEPTTVYSMDQNQRLNNTGSSLGVNNAVDRNSYKSYEQRSTISDRKQLNRWYLLQKQLQSQQQQARQTVDQSGQQFLSTVNQSGQQFLSTVNQSGQQFLSTVNQSGQQFPSGTVNQSGQQFPSGMVNQSGQQFPSGMVNQSGQQFLSGTVNQSGQQFLSDTVNQSGQQFSTSTMYQLRPSRLLLHLSGGQLINEPVSPPYGAMSTK